MAIALIENSVLLDDRTVSFDKVPQAADKTNVVRRVQKAWEGVKSDLNGLNGLAPGKLDVDNVADQLIKSATHAVMFELVLTKAELRLDVVFGKVTIKVASVRVPTAREDYRTFLANLNGWSDGSRNIVPDADFKKWVENHPKKPTVYKDFDEMAKKSKSDVEAFRSWAKTNAKAGKAFAEIDKTAKLKAADPARAKALTAINESLKEYYASF